MKRYLFFVLLILVPAVLDGHCDSLGGPVVADARAALKSGKVDAVLKWVAPRDEAEIRAAFAQALTVRTQSETARELADRWFFENVVRLHRASEGEPFTGLRPSGWTPPPMLESADAAVAAGEIAELKQHLTAEVATALGERFKRVLKAKEHAADSVDAGRAFVAEYTEFMHFVETLHEATAAEH